ncbi:MAG: hypothetical protein ACJAQT_004328, partial [Akkermansiaceae bacterium]
LFLLIVSELDSYFLSCSVILNNRTGNFTPIYKRLRRDLHRLLPTGAEIFDTDS